MPAGQPKAVLPKDLQGVRRQQIGYLQKPQDFLATLGGLGVPQSGLQRQGADAIGAMLNGPTPEQRALDISLPQLQEMLTGQGPGLERDLALANQSGARFGSSNALMRGEALKNLFNMRTQVAQTLGLLSGSAGAANRGLAGQAFQTGTAQAGQMDIETQRRLQILLQFLGVGQQTALNVPTQQGGGIGSLLGGLAGLFTGGLLPKLGEGVAGKILGGGSK